MDEDLEFLEIAEKQAISLVDEEIEHHPELFPQRQILLEGKKKMIFNEMTDQSNNMVKDVQSASMLMNAYLQSLPKGIKESILRKMDEKQDPDKTLQENWGVPNEVMQSIYNLALEHQKNENYSDSTALLKWLILLNPQVSDLWISLGFNQLCEESLNSALESFQNSLAIDPSNMRGYYFSAYTNYLLNDTKVAFEHIEEALQQTQSPDFAEWEPTLNEIKTKILQKD